MVSKTLNEIILAEKQAAEKVDLTNKKAEKIISTANGKAKEIIEKAKLDCLTEAEVIRQNNKNQMTEIFNNYNEKSLIEASKIINKAELKKEKVINRVIEKIILQ